MRLFEAIIDANHRAVAGDANAGLHPAEFADALPVAVLTCIDPRLNGLFPNALALPAEQFIWLRNAGNMITGPLSSTMRSLALACAVEGGREIAIIGHTDCLEAKTPTMKLLEELQALGVERRGLPDNVAEFFGTFMSERPNVMKACEFVRQSPLISPKIPVHGLLIDTSTGRLDWVVNGYQSGIVAARLNTIDFAKSSAVPIGVTSGPANFDYGEMKFPDTKIGDASFSFHPTPAAPASPPSAGPPPVMPPQTPLPPRPPQIPAPPPISPRRPAKY